MGASQRRLIQPPTSTHGQAALLGHRSAQPQRAAQPRLDRAAPARQREMEIVDGDYFKLPVFKATLRANQSVCIQARRGRCPPAVFDISDQQHRSFAIAAPSTRPVPRPAEGRTDRLCDVADGRGASVSAPLRRLVRFQTHQKQITRMHNRRVRRHPTFPAVPPHRAHQARLPPETIAILHPPTSPLLPPPATPIRFSPAS